MVTEDGTKLYPVSLRYALPSELDLMARLAGLELRDRWGSWQREPFTGETRRHVLGLRAMKETVRVACVQAEPAILDRAATLDKLAALTAEAKAQGAQLVVFPETFVPAYPSSAWAKFLAGWADPRAKGAFAQLARNPSRYRGPDADRLGQIAREHEVWLVTGVNERDPKRPGTLYNSLLYHAPDGSLAVTTASSSRRTTSGSSGARATARACARSRPGSAGSAA